MPSTLAAKREDLAPFSLVETCDSKITLMSVEQLTFNGPFHGLNDCSTLL